MRTKKQYSIKNYCIKNGFEPYQFYEELKRHPKYADRLTTDKYGDNVIDHESLMIVGDVLKNKRAVKVREDSRKRNVAAVATEINILHAEIERLKGKIKTLSEEKGGSDKEVFQNTPQASTADYKQIGYGQQNP